MTLSLVRCFLLCGMGLLTLAFPAGAANAPASPPAATAPAALDPADVLRRLASDDWKQRQAAERDLVKLGEEALPAIDAMLKGSGPAKLDAETRGRLEAARRQIVEDRAMGGTYITLHLKDAAPVDAVAALAKASHGPLRTFPDNLFEHGQWPRVTLDVDRVPFWEALRQLCDRVGVAPNGWNDGLRLMPSGDGDSQFDGPSCIDGAFLIVGNEVHHNRSVHLAAGGAAVARAEEDDFGVQLAAFAEPKLTVLSCSETVVLDEAVDDHGNSLRPDDAGGPVDDVGAFVVNRGTVWDLQAPLRYPAKNPGTKIARLRGSVMFTIQSAAETIEIDDPLHATAATTKVVNGVTIEVQPLRKDQDGRGGADAKGYELKLSLTGGASVPGLGHPDAAQLTVQHGLHLLDDKGRALHTRSFGSSSTDGRRTEYRLVYVAGRDEDGEVTGEPAKLVWEIPTGTKQRKAKFELKDLPMP